ncbi:MAG: hypothetical protein C5B56_14245 [Proteobacteria bacterium]|nr:MAG: hypothetical protein C5B56_14245 [Pseudomonadota bacterium]
MKLILWFSASAMLAFSLTSATAKEVPMPGTIVSESSTECGTKTEKHKETQPLLCQEYLVRTRQMEYHIRQSKPVNEELLPLNTPIEFALDKGHMKFKLNGKKYDFLVVSVTPRSPSS